MKICRYKVWKENLELTKPYTIASKTFNKVENIFVYLELENGIYGVGAGAPSSFVTGEELDDSLGVLNKIMEKLCLGKDIRTFRNIIRQATIHLCFHPAALAAVDIALYDGFTKYLQMPLVEYLGMMHTIQSTSVTIGIKSTRDVLLEALEHLDAGFNILKLKVGIAVDQDIETVAMLRKKIGHDITIRVDANQGYNTQELQMFLDATSCYNIEFVEQPFPTGKKDLLFNFDAYWREKIAADEDLITVNDALILSQTPCPYGIFNIKLMKCGGITAGMQIAEIAWQKGIDVMWGCMDESVISISAALHAALASPSTKYLDLDGSLDLAKDIAKGGVHIEGGKMRTMHKPGLGVELLEIPS